MFKANNKKKVFNVPAARPKSKSQLKKEKTVPVVFKHSKEVIFSYKYFKCSCLKDRTFNNCFASITDYAEWITYFLRRISDVSSMSIPDIMNSGKGLRFHPVKDGDLDRLKSVLKTLGVDCDSIFPQSESDEYYELSLGTANGRIFGYVVDNIYYILLFDPNHLIYAYSSKCKLDLFFKYYDPWDEFTKNELRR